MKRNVCRIGSAAVCAALCLTLGCSCSVLPPASGKPAAPASSVPTDAHGDPLYDSSRLDAVMSLNDPSALGAMAALQEHGMLQDTAVYGVDGAPEAKSMISEGAMTATAAQSPIRLGQITAQTVYAILNGEDYEKEITVPVELVTKDNVNGYDMDGWQ